MNNNRIFLNKFKNQTQIVANNIIETVKIDADSRKVRLDICLSCEHLFEPTKNCKKCGCFVHAKTWLKNSKCPIKKW